MQYFLFNNYPNLDVRAASVFDLVFALGGSKSTSGSARSKGKARWGKVEGVKLGTSSIPLTYHAYCYSCTK